MVPDGGPLLHLLPALEPLRRLSRRAVVGAAAPVAAIALVSAGCKREAPAPPPLPAPAPPPPRAGRVLGAAAWAALEAVTERILPSDDGPGAREAGVVAFIDAQLATPVLRPIAAALTTTADLLDRWATARHGVPFARLGPAVQDEILGQLARGTLPVKNFPQREAFRALHALTLEGFLSDPVHGGNAGMVGWRAIDFPEPGVRPTAPGGRPGDGGR
jgi:gluconate 2-dehydrogenase gamma chain